MVVPADKHQFRKRQPEEFGKQASTPAERIKIPVWKRQMKITRHNRHNQQKISRVVGHYFIGS